MKYILIITISFCVLSCTKSEKSTEKKPTITDSVKLHDSLINKYKDDMKNVLHNADEN